jgi:hypothetical protein
LSGLESPIIQLVTQRYTNWAIPDPTVQQSHRNWYTYGK